MLNERWPDIELLSLSPSRSWNEDWRILVQRGAVAEARRSRRPRPEVVVVVEQLARQPTVRKVGRIGRGPRRARVV